MGNSNEIGLAVLLAQVRREIEVAQENLKTSGKKAMLDWESAEIQISFGVTKQVDAKGEAKFYVFAIGAGGSYKSEEVHRLTLKLKPHDDDTSVIVGAMAVACE